MLGNPSSNSYGGQSWNSSDPFYDDGVDNQGTNYYGSAGAGWAQNTQDDYLAHESTVPEYATSYEHQATLSGEQSTHDHDLHPAQPENTHTFDVPMSVFDSTQQQLYPAPSPYGEHPADVGYELHLQNAQVNQSTASSTVLGHMTPYENGAAPGRYVPPPGYRIAPSPSVEHSTHVDYNLYPQDAQANQSMAVPEHTTPYGYCAAPGPSGEHPTLADHDHLAQPENVDGHHAPMPFDTRQPLYPRQAHSAGYPPADVAQHGLAYAQTPYASNQHDNNPAEPFQGVFLRPVSPNSLPAPHTAAPIVHLTPVPVAGPALGPRQPVSKPRATRPRPRSRSAQSSKPGKPCEICGNEFDPKPSNWKRHQDKHTKTMNFKCTLCGTERVTKDQVIIHYIRNHMGLRYRHDMIEERAEAGRYVVALKSSK